MDLIWDVERGIQHDKATGHIMKFVSENGPFWGLYHFFTDEGVKMIGIYDTKQNALKAGGYNSSEK